MVSFNRNSILDATFIFLLIMFEHFIAKKVPQELFHFFEENITAQHIFVFILMYFALILDSSEHSNSIESNLLTAVIVYFSYLAFSKSHLFISLLVIALLVVNLFVDNAIRYYHERQLETRKLEDFSTVIYFCIIAILFISAGITIYEEKLKK